MRLIRYCAPFLLVFALVVSISPNAAAQSKSLPDSLRYPTAALAEGSLQHLLDSLGYSIDVANDELGIETFCAPGGLNTATMVLEVAGSAVSAKSGYYNAASYTQRYQLFGPTATPGTTVTFTVASGITDIGFYMQPNLDGSTVYWYSEVSHNSDATDHVWVFSTGVPREYIVAFEDLVNGGDADYQDLVIKVIFDYDPPSLVGCPGNVTVPCDNIPSPATVTATADCDPNPTVTMTETTTPGSCPQSYTITRTWTATDQWGGSASCSQVITVVDNVAPVMTCPGPVTVQCLADVPAPNTAAVAVSDNCDPSPVVTFEGDVPSGGTCPKIITRTYKAIDACGNYSLCTQTITVDDTTPPVLAGCPSNVTVQCDAIPAAAAVTATDNCDPSPTISMTESTTPGSCPQAYTLTRTWTATDACGNTASCSQVITVVDTTPPVLAGCPSDVTVQCDAIPAAATVTATDNCDASVSVSMTESTTPGSCPQAYTLTRTWTAADDCGNTASCSQVITVVDNVAPVMTCPGPVTVQCMTDVPAPNTGSVSVSDNCDPSPVVTFEGDVPSGGTCPKIITRTYKAIDACGNYSLCTQTITVDDTTPPVLAGCPSNVTVQCDAIPAAATVTATDNCDPSPTISMTESTTPGSCPQAYTLTRTWTATDDCGNTASCSQVITVVDNVAPVMTCPGPVTVQCMTDVPTPNPGSVAVSDNCDPSPVVVFVSDVPSGGSCPLTITRTYQATDACGNQATCTQTITVNDNTPPVMVGCPADVAVECDQIPAPAAVSATDNCDPSPSVTMSETITPGSCAANYVITRTWTAVDNCGNTASCSQLITVSDNTPPVITCPPTVTVECLSEVPAPDVNLLVATDNCDPSPSLLFINDVHDGNSCPGTIARTYRAMDDCGNWSVCQQTIIIDDNTAPVLSGCPTDITISCDETVPSPAAVTATDNCGSATVAFAEVSTPGTCANAYTLTRTWTATDLCGNSTSCSQVITVVDNEAPVLSGCPGDVTVSCDAVPGAATVTATDNCDASVSVVFAETTTPGGCANEYTISRTWSAVDDCGNQASCSQTITVVDDVAPVLAGCPTNLEIACDDALPTPAAVTATDNCGGATVAYAQTEAQGTCPQETIYTRTWTATDACGNTASCSQTITARDLMAPVCSMPADTSYVFCVPTQICRPVSASDDCDPAPTCAVISGPGTIAGGQWCYTPAASGSWDITVRCTDGCGNTCDGTFRVTATVNSAPTITNCPSADATVHWGQTWTYDVDATDPDPGQTLTYSLCSGAPTGLTINSSTGAINWPTQARDICDGDVCVIVSDPCGRADTCEFHVNVVNDPPVIDCLDDISICYEYEFESQITATDPDGGPYGPWFFLVSGPSGLTVDPNSGAIDWPEPTPGSHEICILATDSAHVCDYSPANADTCCFTLKVVALDVVIEKVPEQIQGQYTNVSIDFKYEDVNWPIGGFDFLIQYDPSALCFIKATEGQFITDCAWEYFTYRFGPNGNCGPSACPTGVLRVVAMAETNGGNVANHPDCYTNDGVPSPGPGSTTSTQLAVLNFLVSNDRTYECQFLPIRFIWYDCGDNSLSSVFGDTLHISNQVFDFGGYPADDNWINITGMDNTMPTVTGAPSPECDISFKYELIRCANFYNGGIDLICADSIDLAGDININGIAYEIADAVMFTNYFVNGPHAFDPHFDGSAAASDCNRDGMPLTVADLVYEIRVIVGDAVPYAKSAPVAGRYSLENGVLAVGDGLQISAAVLTVTGQVQPELVADGMEMQYRFDGVNTRIVVLPPLDRSTIQSFTGACLRNVTGDIVSIEMATPEGVTVVAKNVPTTYSLRQNFPNPFNPLTTIEFALPNPGSFELTIINIQGQVVDTYRGAVETPGTVRYEWNAGDRASGIYFYRLSTDDFTATRKMLLLK